MSLNTIWKRYASAKRLSREPQHWMISKFNAYDATNDRIVMHVVGGPGKSYVDACSIVRTYTEVTFLNLDMKTVNDVECNACVMLLADRLSQIGYK